MLAPLAKSTRGARIMKRFRCAISEATKEKVHKRASSVGCRARAPIVSKVLPCSPARGYYLALLRRCARPTTTRRDSNETHEHRRRDEEVGANQKAEGFSSEAAAGRGFSGLSDGKVANGAV